jgi:CDP-diglyceride synthetase
LEIEDKTSNPGPKRLWLLAFAMFIVTMARSVADGQAYFLGRRIGLRSRAAVISLVYEKSLKKNVNESGNGTGNITNLISVDATKILEVCCYLMYVWSTPLQTMFFVLFLLHVAGVAGIAGLMVMILMIPVGGYCGKIIQRLQKELMSATDKRIGAVNEVFFNLM